MKYILDKYFEKTNGFYPFFKYCPSFYREHYLKKRASNILNYEYNWKNPKTLNEKIRWLILNEKTELKSRLTDKILAKSYIAQKLGKNSSAELYGIYDNIDEIDFSLLPDRFALKANHGCKMNIFIKNKTDIYQNYKLIKNITNKWLNINYYDFSLEPQYKNIKRKLLVEYLRPLRRHSFRQDLQIYCFNSEPVLIEVPQGTPLEPYFQIYDTDWKLTPFTHTGNFIEKPLPKPDNLDKILSVCKTISQDFSFVRVDVATDGNDIHIVELTFTPCSAIIPFHTPDLDYKLGEMLHIDGVVSR